MRRATCSAAAAAFITLASTQAFADDTAVKLGSRTSLGCRDIASQFHHRYPADELDSFTECVEKSDFGDATTPFEHQQMYAMFLTAYYIAQTQFGQLTEKDYGSIGKLNMEELAAQGSLAKDGLSINGYSLDRVCSIFSWIECAKLKALPFKKSVVQ